MNSPNPHWKPGDKVDSPVNHMISLDPAGMRTIEVYKLLIGSIVPRPIAFISTINDSGQGNLAPFSFFNGVASNPPSVVFSVSCKPDGSKKDTLINIEQNGQFVVNSANMWLVEAVAQCGAVYPYGVNEMQKVGLTPLHSMKVKPVRVKESAVQMECELYKSLAIGAGGPGSSTLVVGRVLLFHVFDKAYKDGKIILDEIKPAARLGGFAYCGVGDTFELKISEI